MLATPDGGRCKLFAPLATRTHLALVHHPTVDRTGKVITTALTNFDIHDLARSSMTFGLAGYHIVTPITSQRDKAAYVAKLWMDDAQGEHRASALQLVRTADSIETVIEELTGRDGRTAGGRQLGASRGVPGRRPPDRARAPRRGRHRPPRRCWSCSGPAGASPSR